MPTIDLNCDLGESYGRWTLGDDEAMLELASSANVACGFHAGDPTVMRRTVTTAREHGVGIGAHPGYADLRGFGRTAIRMPGEDLENDVLYQLGALAAICRVEGAELRHVKPHGALYITMAHDAEVAGVVARAVAAFDPSLALLVAAGSIAADVAADAGLRPVREAFLDRAYRPDGALAPRREPGSVLRDPEMVAARAVRLATEGTVDALDGSELVLHPETLCLHGDTPGAVELARRVVGALEDAGIRVAQFAR